MTYEFQEALRPRRRWCRGAMGMAGLVWGGGGEGYGERKEQVTSLQETSHCSLHSTLRSTAVVVCAVRRQGRHRSVVICWQRGAPASAPTNAVTSSSGIFPLSEEENVSGKKLLTALRSVCRAFVIVRFAEQMTSLERRRLRLRPRGDVIRRKRRTTTTMTCRRKSWLIDRRIEKN